MDVLFCIIRKSPPSEDWRSPGIYINCANGSFLENEKFAGIRFPFINMFFFLQKFLFFLICRDTPAGNRS